MALTDREQERIVERLKSKVKGPCPMCGLSNWSVGENIVATHAASPQGGLSIGGGFIPMVQVVCTECGFVAHHAAKLLGVEFEG